MITMRSRSRVFIPATYPRVWRSDLRRDPAAPVAPEWTSIKQETYNSS